MGTLDGRRVAILATDGVEEVELTEPRDAVTEAGATAEIVSLDDGEIQAMNGDIEPAGKYRVDRRAADVSAADYDAVIMPGGTVNADRLRMDADVVRFVQDVFAAGKPVGAICHAPWTLIEAGVVRDRTLTSFPSLQTDLRNAGANWVDEDVHVDQGLVTSRKPDDIPAFNKKLIEELAEGKHEQQAAKTTAATS
jgi:protease I